MIKLQTITDQRGNLTVIEKTPFEIKRVYYLYGVPKNKDRGGHKHKITERIIVAIAGSFDAQLNDDEPIYMSSPKEGLFIPKMTWLKLTCFSPDAVCLVLASTEHEESDCIR